MQFPYQGDAAQLQDWIRNEYNQATAHKLREWKPSELLGASEATLKGEVGDSIGGRLFGLLNTIKSRQGI